MLYKERWEEEHCRGPPSTASLTRALGRTPQAMCDLLWTLWGLLQHKNGNPAEDFWAYATGRFVRCQRLMARPDFAQHVAAVRAGIPQCRIGVYTIGRGGRWQSHAPRRATGGDHSLR